MPMPTRMRDPDFRIPEDLSEPEREHWNELGKQRVAILGKIVALLAEQCDGAAPENLSPERLRELEGAAVVLTEEWEAAEPVGGMPPPKTQMERLLAEYCRLGEEMMDIIDTPMS